MKTAEEMFKELDFECAMEDYDTIYYGRDHGEVIIFNKLDKLIELIDFNYITLSLHKAITKKMEELGWL